MNARDRYILELYAVFSCIKWVGGRFSRRLHPHPRKVSFTPLVYRTSMFSSVGGRPTYYLRRDGFRIEYPPVKSLRIVEYGVSLRRRRKFKEDVLPIVAIALLIVAAFVSLINVLVFLFLMLIVGLFGIYGLLEKVYYVSTLIVEGEKYEVLAIAKELKRLVEEKNLALPRRTHGVLKRKTGLTVRDIRESWQRISP